jgi:hypothetical protein
LPLTRCVDDSDTNPNKSDSDDSESRRVASQARTRVALRATRTATLPVAGRPSRFVDEVRRRLRLSRCARLKTPAEEQGREAGRHCVRIKFGARMISRTRTVPSPGESRRRLGLGNLLQVRNRLFRCFDFDHDAPAQAFNNGYSVGLGSASESPVSMRLPSRLRCSSSGFQQRLECRCRGPATER